MSKPLVTVLGITALITLVAITSNDARLNEQVKLTTYCERVDLYELDVMLGKSEAEIRGHRDYDNLCN